eukprot:9438586-Lingulodinium_polyedra.AAC.1
MGLTPKHASEHNTRLLPATIHTTARTFRKGSRQPRRSQPALVRPCSQGPLRQRPLRPAKYFM